MGRWLTWPRWCPTNTSPVVTPAGIFLVFLRIMPTIPPTGDLWCPNNPAWFHQGGHEGSRLSLQTVDEAGAGSQAATMSPVWGSTSRSPRMSIAPSTTKCPLSTTLAVAQGGPIRRALTGCRRRRSCRHRGPEGRRGPLDENVPSLSSARPVQSRSRTTWLLFGSAWGGRWRLTRDVDPVVGYGREPGPPRKR